MDDLSVCASVCPVHCGKTADRIRMPFGIVGRTGPMMRQVVGFGDQSVHGKGYFGGGRISGAPLSTGTYRAFVCYSAATRPSSQITCSFRQTCSIRVIFSVYFMFLFRVLLHRLSLSPPLRLLMYIRSSTVYVRTVSFVSSG